MSVNSPSIDENASDLERERIGKDTGYIEVLAIEDLMLFLTGSAMSYYTKVRIRHVFFDPFVDIS